MPRELPLWARDDDPGTAASQAIGPRPEDPTLLHEGASWREARPGREGLGPAPDDEPQDPSGSGFFRRAAIAATAVGAVAAGAAGTALLVDGDDDGSRPATAAPLAAAPGRVDVTKAGDVYRAAGKSVVQVRRQGGSGTGWLIDADGTVVTNAHVVGGASDVRLILDDGKPPVEADVLGTDPSTDLAVLSVDADDVRGIRPLALADSNNVKVGELAVAIGYPLGLQRTVTQGIVSGVGRSIEAPNGFSIDEVIQTDAPINPGNSGGPLLDARGRVIGVNSQIATAGGGGGNVGIGFAVPANTVREVVPVLKSGGIVRRPFIGVSTGAAASGTPGAVVREVRPGSPAERSGLRAGQSLDGSDGDVIVNVDGKPVQAPEDVARAISGRKPGDVVAVTVLRGGDRVTLELRLGERPESAGP